MYTIGDGGEGEEMNGTIGFFGKAKMLLVLGAERDCTFCCEGMAYQV